MNPFWRLPTFFATSPWQKSSGSLTARLKVCGQFSVTILDQALTLPSRDEVFALGLGRRRMVFARTVCLSVNHQPCVIARSVVSQVSMRRAWQQMRRQGNRPLGERLWTNPRVKRSALQFTVLQNKHRLHQVLKEHWPPLPSSIPARRAVFRLKQQPLLVMEVFLPHVQELPCPLPR